MTDARPNNTAKLNAAIKVTWASIKSQQWHGLMVPYRTDAGICAKEALTKY